MPLGKGRSESNDDWVLITACTETHHPSPSQRTFEPSHQSFSLESRDLLEQSFLIPIPADQSSMGSGREQ